MQYDMSSNLISSFALISVFLYVRETDIPFYVCVIYITSFSNCMDKLECRLLRFSMRIHIKIREYSLIYVSLFTTVRYEIEENWYFNEKLSTKNTRKKS